MPPHQIRYSRLKPIPLLFLAGLVLWAAYTDVPLTQGWAMEISLFGIAGGATFIFLVCFFDRRVQILIDENGLTDRRIRRGQIRWDRIRSVTLFSLTRLPTSPRLLVMHLREPARSPIYFSVSFLEQSPAEILAQIERRLGERRTESTGV